MYMYIYIYIYISRSSSARCLNHLDYASTTCTQYSTVGRDTAKCSSCGVCRSKDGGRGTFEGDGSVNGLAVGPARPGRCCRTNHGCCHRTNHTCTSASRCRSAAARAFCRSAPKYVRQRWCRKLYDVRQLADGAGPCCALAGNATRNVGVDGRGGRGVSGARWGSKCVGISLLCGAVSPDVFADASGQDSIFIDHIFRNSLLAFS